jgi:hypothetical protein
MRRSVRIEEKKSIQLKQELKNLTKNFENFKTKFEDFSKQHQKQTKEFRVNRKDLLDFFNSSGGNVCKVCFVHKANPILPCTHCVVCLKCILNLEKKICPICREQIDDVVLKRSNSFNAPLFYLQQKSSQKVAIVDSDQPNQ